ncbi:hypothetical protein O4H61_01595 [Roseovarius aestuarii]|nr:hypothetical protein [Roseovarius aestuarii]
MFRGPFAGMRPDETYQNAAVRGVIACLRGLLLIALLFSGTVPDGMMRVAQPGEGLRLVLCTPEGISEVWLAEDGSVTPVENAPSGSDVDHTPTQCVQVSATWQAQTAPMPTPVRWARSFTLARRGGDQIALWSRPGRPQLSRAPPVPA